MNILKQAKRVGVRLWLVEDQVHYAAPATSEAQSFLASIRDRKEEVRAAIDPWYEGHEYISVPVIDMPRFLGEHGLVVDNGEWKQGGEPTLYVKDAV